MRVLGKPEVEDAVRFDELDLLLKNFGVRPDQEPKSLNDATLKLSAKISTVNSNKGSVLRELTPEPTRENVKHVEVNASVAEPSVD